jgi:hypothetical protein
MDMVPDLRQHRLAASLNGIWQMTIYSVSITLLGDCEAEWLAWMRTVHVPDVVNTGCFKRCTISRVVEPAVPGEASFVMQYECDSPDDYERYRTEFAPRLQKEHSEKFAGRFRGARQLLQRECDVQAD